MASVRCVGGLATSFFFSRRKRRETPTAEVSRSEETLREPVALRMTCTAEQQVSFRGSLTLDGGSRLARDERQSGQDGRQKKAGSNRVRPLPFNGAPVQVSLGGEGGGGGRRFDREGRFSDASNDLTRKASSLNVLSNRLGSSSTRLLCACLQCARTEKTHLT